MAHRDRTAGGGPGLALNTPTNRGDDPVLLVRARLRHGRGVVADRHVDDRCVAGELDTARALLERSFGPIYRHKPEGDWIRGDLEKVEAALADLG